MFKRLTCIFTFLVAFSFIHYFMILSDDEVVEPRREDLTYAVESDPSVRLFHKNFRLFTDYFNLTRPGFLESDLIKDDEDSITSEIFKVKQLWNYNIHPLYMYLQERSPLWYREDMNVDQVQVGDIGVHGFYDKYLSKSMPLLIKGACKDWKVTSSIKAIEQRNATYDERRAAIYDYIETLFTADRHVLDNGKVKASDRTLDIDYWNLALRPDEHEFAQGIGQGKKLTKKKYRDFA